MTSEQNNKKRNYMIAASILVILCVASVFIFKKRTDNQSIKIGALLPLTKQASQYGIATKHGIDMRVEEINNSGGINGKKIECIEFDDEGDPAKAIVGYNYLKEKGVSGIITGVISETALSIVDQFSNDDIPIIMTTASADDVTFNKDSGKVYQNVFRIGVTNSFQGEKAAEFAKSRNKENAAVLFCGESEYSSGLKDSFVSKCKNLGINVSITENFTLNSVDFQRQLENIKSKNPDFIFIPYYRDTIALILSQADKLEVNCMMFGPDGWRGVTKYVPDISCLKNKNYFYCDLFDPDEPSGSAKPFSEEYQKKYGEIADLCSVAGYEAIQVFENAVRLGGNITDNIGNTNINCISGNMSFDEYNNSKRKVVIIRIEDGEEKFYKKI